MDHRGERARVHDPRRDRPVRRRIAGAIALFAISCGSQEIAEPVAQVEAQPAEAMPPEASHDVAMPVGPLLSRRGLTREGALVAIAAVVGEARRHGTGAAVAVVDEGGHLVAFERVDTTFTAGAEVSIGKAQTAVAFRRPTSFFERIIREGRTPMVALEHFTPLQGGVPITVGNEIVGGIGVSGATNAEQDEAYALVGAQALARFASGEDAGMQEMASEETFLDHEQVRAAFERGMPLTETDEYKVHASRRVMPGEVEIHEHDTDIIYVLSGEATLVLGGTPVDPRTIAEGEIRAPRAEGGEEHHLVPGDVLVIPRTMPHWFRDVPGPMTYYVVKVSDERPESAS